MSKGGKIIIVAAIVLALAGAVALKKCAAAT
jgi:hypothetical protein